MVVCASAYKTATGEVGGDPVFTGFHGQEFIFNGHMNKYYHVFSDPYVSINALFTDANPYDTYGGTIMKDMSVTYSGNTIVVNRDSRRVHVGNDIMIAPDFQELALCVTAEATHEYFEIVTPQHIITIKYMWNNIPHLNTTYLDLGIDLAPNSVPPTQYGGIIGCTVNDGQVIVASEKAWSTSTLFATDSTDNKYQAEPFGCHMKEGGSKTHTSQGLKRAELLSSEVRHRGEIPRRKQW